MYNHSEIWQAPWQQCCCISKWCDNLNYQSWGFKTSRDLTMRRLIRYWNRVQIFLLKTFAWSSLWIIIVSISSASKIWTYWGENNAATFLQETFKIICIFLKEIFVFWLNFLLKLAHWGPIDKTLLVKVMAWWQTGDKPLPEPNDWWSSWLVHIYVTRGAFQKRLWALKSKSSYNVKIA